MSRRFPVPQLDPSGGPVRLSPETTRHLQVLRLGVGDQLQLFDGRGRQATARIIELGSTSALVESEPCTEAIPISERVVLVQCLPKSSKLEAIVRSCTEVGVHAVQLAQSERSVSRGPIGDARLARLRRIATEAARQSQRSFVPEIRNATSLIEAVAMAPNGATRWFCSPRTEARPAQVAGADLWVAIGPEGGFSPEEGEALTSLGWLPTRLSESTLRVETAAPIAVALALDRLRPEKNA